jgi:hypothetical protein
MAINIAAQQQLAQPVSAFFEGRAMQRAEQESSLRMRALENAEGRATSAETRAQEGFDIEKRAANAKFDEIAGKKALAGAKQVLGLPKGQRKAFVEKNFPELVHKLSEQEYGWDEVDEDEIEEMATGIAARASADLGLAPEKPESYTLGPGEQRVVGGKVVAENTTEDKDSWTNPEPVVIGGKNVMAQVNKKTGEPRIVPGATPIDDKSEKDQTFDRANTLRDEYVTQSKDFVSVQSAYSTITALGKSPSAAGDIGLLTSFMRMVDPGSTVREGELATAENAGGVPDNVRSRYNNLLRGERLSEDQRKDFIGQAKNMFDARKGGQKKLRGTYKDLATRSKVDPLDVIGAEEEEAQEAPAPAGPTATGPNDERIMLQNGKWVPVDG